jgi:hypothetical protein
LGGVEWDDCASGVPERLLAVAISFRSRAAKLLVDVTASAWHAAWKTYRRVTLAISEQVYEICKLTFVSGAQDLYSLGNPASSITQSGKHQAA